MHEAEAVRYFERDGVRMVELTEAAYRRAQERQRIAEVMRESAERHADNVSAWACDAFAEQRRLAHRLTFVWGIAVRHGATDADLRGDA